MRDNSTKALQWKQTKRKSNVTDRRVAEKCAMKLKRMTDFFSHERVRKKQGTNMIGLVFCKADFDYSVDMDLKEGQSGVWFRSLLN